MTLSALVQGFMSVYSIYYIWIQFVISIIYGYIYVLPVLNVVMLLYHYIKSIDGCCYVCLYMMIK